MELNYTVNMNVLEIICQPIPCFPTKQGLTINLLCPALKGKQPNKQTMHIEVVDTIFTLTFGGGECFKVYNQHNTTFAGYLYDHMLLI